VFENRVLRRIFGYKREKLAGGWRRLHNEELHNLYASPNIIKGSNQRGLGGLDMRNACDRWEMHTVLWMENLKLRHHSEGIGVNGKIIL
jgi:hypothetical protein